MSSEIVGAIIALVFLIGLFIVLREVVMWYWKINTMIRNQEMQIRAQQETNNLLSELINLYKTKNAEK